MDMSKLKNRIVGVGVSATLLGLLASCGAQRADKDPLGLVSPADCAFASNDLPQLRRQGRWLVDQHGRVVLTHGVNLVWKNPPFVPPDEAAGFTAADADWLARHGFNSARIGTLWVGVSPEAPGEINHDYLAAWDRIIDLLAARGIWTLFDFHQDMLGPIYQGEGVPEWAILPGIATTALGPPGFGFPFNYFTPQVSEAFDNLWAERGPVRDGYAAAWRAVAERWRDQPYSMGYDLLNEPWAGLEWPTCLVPPQFGCPGSDAREIQPFFEHALAAIREVDAKNLVWLEPQLLAGGTGSPTGFEPIPGEEQLGYSIHNYCPLTALAQAAELGLVDPAVLPDTCEGFEADVFEQARITAERIGAVEVVTEFGATDDLALLRRVTALADANLVGWQYWAYKEWGDPTTQSQDSGAQGLFTDDADLASVKRDKLAILERTYPQATAGIPQSLAFDPVSGEFEYRYITQPAGADTEIHIPAQHYPGGYEVEIAGAQAISAPDASPLKLRNESCDGSPVQVRVRPRRIGQ